MLGSMIITFFCYLLFAYFQHQLAKKASLEHSWFAYVPLLNFVQMMELAKVSRWWALSFFFAPVGLIVGIWAFCRISKNFGERSVFGILLIIPPINVWALWRLNKISNPQSAEDLEILGEIKKALENKKSKDEIKAEAIRCGVSEEKFKNLYKKTYLSTWKIVLFSILNLLCLVAIMFAVMIFLYVY